MSWGTDFNVSVFVKNKELKDKQDAENVLEEVEDDKQYVKSMLISLASMTPQRQKDEDMGDVASSIITRVDELLEMYSDAVYLQTKTYLFLESLEQEEFKKNNPNL